ncbi:hypothetical protein [Streptosporangium sp. NPDC000396]|uniref:hypothetical protein n=1 Tax=Streptosporangium sp. NPDC000396 TaxID=3366185 RepID=UPI003683F016
MATGNAYFYNLSEQDVVIDVNNFNGDKVAGLGSAPYSPNKSSNGPYQRYDTAEPQQGQFGTTNTLEYNVAGGGGGKVSVTINVDFGRYPANMDLIVYLYNSAVMVMSPSDSVPYLGKNGQTIQVGPGSDQRI